MKSIFSRFRKHHTMKNRGDVLIITLILSAFMLLVGIALSRFLLQDLYFVRNLIWSETAYFAAESGVEDALVKLKENPVANINGPITITGNVVSNLEVDNLKTSYSFTMNPNETRRFRLERDGFPPMTDWGFKSDQPHISWRLICQKNDPGTAAPLGNVAIQGKFTTTSGEDIISFASIEGTFDDIDEATGDDETTDIDVSDFFIFSIDTPAEQESCFMNYQYTPPRPGATDPLNPATTVIISHPDGLSPDRVKIKSIGQAGQKTKVIETVFNQSGLGSLFDFGILLTD